MRFQSRQIQFGSMCQLQGKKNPNQNQIGNQWMVQGWVSKRSARQNRFFRRDDLETTSSSWYQLTESAVFTQAWPRISWVFFSLARPSRTAAKLRFSYNREADLTCGFPSDSPRQEKGICACFWCDYHRTYWACIWSQNTINIYGKFLYPFQIPHNQKEAS